MAKAEKTAVVPRLRFPEFADGEWSAATLSELATFVDERVGATESVPYTVTSGVGLVSQVEKLGRTIAGNSLKNYIVLRRDDFAYNKSATKSFPEGYIARYVGDERAAVPNSIFKCFRADNKKIKPAYLDYLFASNLHGKWLRNFITVGARAHGSLNVNDTDLMALPVPLPVGASSLQEQQKIADCLSSLDDLIAAQGRKVEALKTYKRGLVQQLFPREGETRPRLRFPEFRDAPEWKEVKAGTLFANRMERGDDSLPIYSVTMTEGLVRRASLARRIDDLAESTGNKKAYRYDIAYNMMRMWQGACGVAGEECMVSPAYVVLAPQSDVHSPFYGFLLKLPHMLRLFTAHSRGLTEDRLRLYYQDFSSILLPQPDMGEQERIADGLMALEARISDESEKLDRLKAHKKGLMQQLFPSLEAA